MGWLLLEAKQEVGALPTLSGRNSFIIRLVPATGLKLTRFLQ